MNDPWTENQVQEKQEDDLGFLGTVISKVLVTIWLLSYALGMLLFWPYENILREIIGISVLFLCFIFIFTKPVASNKAILHYSFIGLVLLSVLAYII